MQCVNRLPSYLVPGPSYWPRKKDLVIIDRPTAASVVAEYGNVFGLDTLRVCSNFKHLQFSKASGIENVDLEVAVCIAIEAVQEQTGDPRAKKLMRLLEKLLGRLDQPIAVAIGGAAKNARIPH